MARAVNRPASRALQYVHVAMMLAVFFAVWESLVWFLKIPPYLLPRPSAIAIAIVAAFPSLLRHTYASLQATVGGFAAGAIVSMVLGPLVIYNGLAKRAFMPTIIFLNALPKVALAPIIVVWLGFGMLTNVTITATVAFFPILVNFIAGLEDIREEEYRLMASYNASKWQVFRHVQLYRSLPYLFAGFKVGIVLAVIGTVVAEFVAGKEGLGYWVFVKMNYFQTQDMFGGVVLLGFMSVLLYGVVEALQGFLMPWQKSKTTVSNIS